MVCFDEMNDVFCTKMFSNNSSTEEATKYLMQRMLSHYHNIHIV